MAILSPELAAKIARWKSAGQEIVFTNGVFDLLHPGHVAIMQEARASRRRADRGAEQRRLGAGCWARAMTARCWTSRRAR